MILSEQMVERYYELHELMKHPEYILSEDEWEEWTQLCEDLLYELMFNHSDVLERLKRR